MDIKKYQRYYLVFKVKLLYIPAGPGPVLSVDSVAVSLRLTLEGLPAKTEAPPGSAILLKECLTCPDLAGLP